MKISKSSVNKNWHVKNYIWKVEKEIDICKRLYLKSRKESTVIFIDDHSRKYEYTFSKT